MVLARNEIGKDPLDPSRIEINKFGGNLVTLMPALLSLCYSQPASVPFVVLVLRLAQQKRHRLLCRMYLYVVHCCYNPTEDISSYT